MLEIKACTHFIYYFRLKMFQAGVRHSVSCRVNILIGSLNWRVDQFIDYALESFTNCWYHH